MAARRVGGSEGGGAGDRRIGGRERVRGETDRGGETHTGQDGTGRTHLKSHSSISSVPQLSLPMNGQTSDVHPR